MTQAPSLDELDEMLGFAPAGSPASGAGASAGAGDDLAMGAFEAADRREKLINWNPHQRAADAEILPEKRLLDARVRDTIRNDAYAAAGATLHKDHIVGSRFLLNAKPRTLTLFGKADEIWEEEFQAEVEEKFDLWAESDRCWPDASKLNTLTELVRLAIGTFSGSGEILSVSEWMTDDGKRPFQTAVLMLDPDRLVQPRIMLPQGNIRGGVERDRRGAPIAYHILNRHPSDISLDRTMLETKRVMARKPSGRQQVFHAYEQLRPDQSRGISVIVSALSEMRMLKQFRRIELERAATAAMYGASVETDLPSADAYAMMGGDATNPMMKAIEDHMAALTDFASGAKNMQIEGVKIPFLPMGSKLKLQSTGADSPVGSELEASFMRHMAASFGVSYEQFSRDYSKSNYSSMRGAIGETLLHMQALKRRTADRFAGYVYRLWFEEAINVGAIEAVKGGRFPSFYEGMNADAYCACEWIGAGQGQTDPLKETQAAMLRIRGGLTTFEHEIARLWGSDWRAVTKQRAREHKAIEAAGLPSPFVTEPTDAENAATGEPRETKE